MSQFTLTKWLIAAAMLLPCVASAAGMGRLTVLSALGQPLSAEIELLAVQNEELASLSARLASPEAYQQANLQYGSALIGLRISIEKRASGQPFVRVTSSRPVNEPFLDLLIELNWASGRLVREFTALLDPPGMAPPAPVTAAPLTPAAARPAPAPTAVAPAARAAVPAGSYGPIERGETLSGIANRLKPEGVTLDQMLVGLYRSNPDAFIKKNMNLVRSGKILRVPEKDEIAAIPQGEAVKEYRAQVAEWKSYRTQLGEAPAAAREGGPAVSGRIATRIDDKAAAEPKDVVRLSKGEAPREGAAATGTGAKGSSAERIKTLEEEVTAREKALREANERIVQLEKTVKDMQRLAEIKSAGMAAAQQQAQARAEPKPEPVKPEAQAAAKTEPAAPTPEPTSKPEAAAASKPGETPVPKPEAAKAAEKAAPKPSPSDKPKPGPEAKAQPSTSAPGLLETLSDPVYLGGGAVIVLGGLGYWLMRRRREQEQAVVELPAPATPAPVKPEVGGASVVQEAAPAVTAAPELDAIDEASVYVNHGRDAQAEAILKEAIAKNPGREALHVRLLEIYALRRDKAGFAKHAGEFHQRTGGTGDNWIKVAAMGFGLDPANPLFGGGRDATVATAVMPAATTADLDFNLEAPAVEGVADAAASAAPDIELEVPATSAAAVNAAVSESGTIDFEVELPTLEVPPATTVPGAPSAAAKDAGGGLDFKLDLAALDLSLDDKKPGTAVPVVAHEPHWYDVQAKFDLVKAYQEMGDKTGATEILKEVLREGDAGQQAQARALLDRLG